MLAAKPTSPIDREQLECSQDRRRKAAALIQHWLEDESDHDERFWPVLEVELEESRLRCRE